MSVPPGHKPPGYRLSSQSRADVDRVYRVRGSVASVEGYTARTKRREQNAKRAMQHDGPFRDSHEVLREANGKFARETAPPHKRPKRIPWEKKKKQRRPE